MSNEDPYRPNPGRDPARDRGAYTPPTDDDLPFNRGGYDPRRGGGGKAPPMTLIISILVLLALIIGVVVIYNMGGLRKSEDAPPAVGAPVGEMKADAPIDAQPIDPEAGINVYSDAELPTDAPTFTPAPEAVQPRPLPAPAPVAGRPLPAPAPSTPATRPAPVPVTPPAPATETPAPRPAPAGGTSGVQIGAFSTPTLAEREYNAIVGRYPQFTGGASRRVQEVTGSNGSTLYRTTVSGLSREQATGLCSAIKSAGGDCFVR